RSLGHLAVDEDAAGVGHLVGHRPPLDEAGNLQILIQTHSSSPLTYKKLPAVRTGRTLPAAGGWGAWYRESFSALPCLKTLRREAAMGSGSWVRGLMPCRSARSRTSKVPKPEIVTFSPLARALLRASNTAFTALSASFLVMSVFAATCAVRSALVIKWYLQIYCSV